MIRSIRILGVTVLTIETTDEKPPAPEPGSFTSTPMTVIGFDNVTEGETA